MVEEYVLEFARAEQAGEPFEFRFEPQHYLLRSAGGGFESAELPWDSSLLKDLTAIRQSHMDRVIVQRIGELLRRVLTPLGFADQAARIVAADRAGQPIILTIRSAAAELYALPWELLTEKGSGHHLGGLPNVLLRYEWPQTHTTPETPKPRTATGRILFAWSAAGGAVPVSEQAQAIRKACKTGSVSFEDARDVLAHASCQTLCAALEKARAQNQPIAILHLLCHGGQTGSTFGLVLGGEEPGESVVVDAGTLRQLLSPFADMVRLVVISACDSGNSGALGNQLGSVAQALHRAGFASVIASRNPLAVTASIKLTETLYDCLLNQTQSLEQALRSVRNRLLRDPSQLDWSSIQLYARSEDGVDSRPILFRPYRGLLAFQPQHNRFFFGRDREIEQIKKALSDLGSAQRPRFLIVAGTSGSGKSSVVLAGALPQLLKESGGSPKSIILKPGSDPVVALDKALAATDPADGELLLIIDQLEEIFTHVSSPAVRTEFMRRLWTLAQQPTVQIIATLRVDFIGECGGIMLEDGAKGLRLDNVAYDEAHRVFVAQLGIEQIRATIEGPALKVGLVLEAGLTNRMVEAVGAEPGALPLLQHTLDLLWLRRDGRALTQSSYDEIGQLAGALSQHADALIVKMDEVAQQTVRNLLVRLVHLGDGVTRATRQRVPVGRLRPSGQDAQQRFAKILTELENARLLVRSGESDQQSIEVAHEALIRSWPRFAEWLQRDRQMLAELEKLEVLLNQWQQHRALLTGEQLRFAERFTQDYPEHVPDEAKTLLASSKKEERRTKSIKRGVLLLLLSGSVFYLGETLIERFTTDRTDQARKQLAGLINRASNNPTTAEMLGTLARLRMELELRPDLALELNFRARELEPHNPRLLVDQAEYLLAAGRFAEVSAPAQSALQSNSGLLLLRLHSAVVAWSAARFLLQAQEQEQWGERLQAEYDKLPDGTELIGLAGTSQVLLKAQHQLRATLPLTDVLEVHALLRGVKSDAKGKALAKRLRTSLQWSIP